MIENVTLLISWSLNLSKSVSREPLNLLIICNDSYFIEIRPWIKISFVIARETGSFFFIQ